MNKNRIFIFGSGASAKNHYLDPNYPKNPSFECTYPTLNNLLQEIYPALNSDSKETLNEYFEIFEKKNVLCSKYNFEDLFNVVHTASELFKANSSDVSLNSSEFKNKCFYG